MKGSTAAPNSAHSARRRRMKPQTEQGRLARAAEISHKGAAKHLKLELPATLALALRSQIDEGRGEWILGGSPGWGEWVVSLTGHSDGDEAIFDITAEQGINGAEDSEGADTTHVAVTKFRITVKATIEELERRTDPA